MKKNLKIKAFAKTVQLFAVATLLALLMVGAVWGICLGFAYLLAEEILTPLTVGVAFFVGVLICAFIRVYREMYKKLKDEDELKEQRCFDEYGENHLRLKMKISHIARRK